MARLHILLADDHTIVRQGIRKILEAQADWEVVAEAGDGREAVRQALELKPDIAVLDIGELSNGERATCSLTSASLGHRAKNNGGSDPMSETADRVKKIVVEHLGVEPDKVTEDASFIDDLGADSLDIVELVMAFEEEFGVEIPDDAAEKITTVRDAIDYIDQNKG